MTNIQYHQELTKRGRRGAMKEVERMAGCRTKNDVARVLLHNAKSKYTEAVRAAAAKVVAWYEKEEKEAEAYRASRTEKNAAPHRLAA